MPRLCRGRDTACVARPAVPMRSRAEDGVLPTGRPEMALLHGKNLRRTARLLAIAGAALVPAIATAVSAHAASQPTTRYYTIDVRPSYECGMSLFLGATAGDNVRTARYASDDH